jgi:hypothetical protein
MDGATMDLIIPQAAAVSIDLAAWHHRDRIARIHALIPEDATAGLIWLALNYPATCDAMLDKIEWDGIDDPDPGREPEPCCALCGADTGIFLRHGLDWRHYRGDGTLGQAEPFDPGHAPVIAWRPARTLAAAH